MFTPETPPCYLTISQSEICYLSSVQSLSLVWLFATPGTAARQASLSITNFRSSLKLMPIESVMPSNHLTFCCPLLLPPSIFPSIRIFSNESVLHIRWPKYWSFSFISPSKVYSRLISVLCYWLAKGEMYPKLLIKNHTNQKCCRKFQIYQGRRFTLIIYCYNC